MTATLDFAQIERRFRQLQKQHQDDKLDEEAFRFEVAKLIAPDARGIFWMIDADSGQWFCNRGDHWEAGDPYAEPPPKATPLDPETRTRRRRRQRILFVLGLMALVALAVAWLFNQGYIPNPWLATPLASGKVQVTIAAPASGSRVSLGQEIAVESTLSALPNLQGVASVQLQVNDQIVDTEAVRPKIEPQQTSLPLSQPWRPNAAGEYRLTVRALSAGGEVLGAATVPVYVVQSSDEALPEPACTPGVTFLRDVTIAPGTEFPPQAQMEKVWQVRNSGSCAWGVGYELVHVEGQDLGAPARMPMPATAAGETADLSITFQAPVAAGPYDSVWQIQAPNGRFFGPRLILSINVQARAKESRPPNAPVDLSASVREDEQAVRLTWLDRSDDEDAFRIYREDIEASIGLVPADTAFFVDENVLCGHQYRYAVVAFNAAGPSPISETAAVTLPPCVPTDAPPALSLSVVPTQVVTNETFTITFEATDDLGVDLVIVWGENSNEPNLDMGRVFTCSTVYCSATWTLSFQPDVLEARLGEDVVGLTVLAIARDSSGHQSDLAQTSIEVVPSE